MKAVFITIGIGILVFAAIQIFAMSSRKKTESYPYEVIKTYNDFEVRIYEASLFTSVRLASTEYGQASNEGFRVLAGYIFGGNNKEERIAMTSPVAMSLEDTMTMMFMVPRNMNKEDLPKPNNGSIKFEELPAKKLAAITFGGWANNDKIEKYKNRLVELLQQEGIKHTDKFLFFGYNPPYETTNRRNEVLVELE